MMKLPNGYPLLPRQRVKQRFSRVYLLIVTVLPGSIIGCSWDKGIFKVDQCADVACGAIPANAGSHVCQWQQEQVRAASASSGVFYQADFVGHSDRLSPAAEQQIVRLVQQSAIGIVPIIWNQR